MTEADDSLGVEVILEENRLRSEIVSEAKKHCAPGELLDAQAFLALHPEFQTRKSVVLDLAYEEFCQRLEAGESVDADSYCRRFSAFDKSLGRLIAVHALLEDNPQWLPTTRVDWPQPGELFEGFSILAELGRGAFARVFLAREIALGNRLVAVKVSSEGAAEADILGKLRHPNIVPVLSVRQHQQTGLTVVCMPYLGNSTLYDVLDHAYSGGACPSTAKEILRGGRSSVHDELTPDEVHVPDRVFSHGLYVDAAIHLASQIADALAYSHRQGICHSDLKPSNVLITASGRPMLLDFNLAFDPNAVERRLGGTLPYMSPEQLRAMDGSSGNVSVAPAEATDVYSLGVILYEMLSGRLPFGPISMRDSREEIRTRLLKQQETGPFPLRKANKQVDPALARLVESCLAFDPGDRPRSADALAAALRRSISPVRRSRRWVQRHRWLVGSVAAFFLLICLGVGHHLSTRDPYAVRQLNAGVKHYGQNDYAQAEEHFTLAIESTEERAEALCWRARTRQKAGRTLLALEDYEEAAKLCSAPEIHACQAYCWALEGYFRDSILDSNEAIDAGFATAEVYNNLGYCYLRTGDFKSAVPALTEAIRLDDRLQPALHNRALAELRWAANKGRPVDGQAGTDIDSAINAGPPSAELYLNAACIYYEIGGESGQHRERIIRYLCQAIRLGQDQNTIQREFKSLLDSPPIEALLTDVVPGGKPTKALHLVDPFADDSFQPCATSAQLRRPF